TGEWGVIDERELLAAAVHHVAVDCVPAGVANAAGKPAAIDAGGGVEHLLRRLDPVDGLRSLGPEALRVALPAGVDLMVAAGAGIHGAAPVRSASSRLRRIVRPRATFASRAKDAR